MIQGLASQEKEPECHPELSRELGDPEGLEPAQDWGGSQHVTLATEWRVDRREGVCLQAGGESLTYSYIQELSIEHLLHVGHCFKGRVQFGAVGMERRGWIRRHLEGNLGDR